MAVRAGNFKIEKHMTAVRSTKEVAYTTVKTDKSPPLWVVVVCPGNNGQPIEALGVEITKKTAA